MRKRALRKQIVVGLAILLAFGLVGLFGLVPHAYASSHVVRLKNGETYDISKAPKKTILRIDDETCSGTGNVGRVRLTGQSSRVWVHIMVSSGKTVTVDLADGLSIKPGKDSANGIGPKRNTLAHSRSGIYIDETKDNIRGGIVVLRSEPGASIEISSYKASLYQTVPAIMKNNTKTKLVFETKDRSNPGTIVAKPSGGGAVAIGAFGHGVLGIATTSHTVGNIDFASGNIEAYGHDDGAGIGAFAYSHVGEIYFSGAHVIAKAGNKGDDNTIFGGAAGIGGDYKSKIEKIKISGGYVEAWGYGSANDAQGRPMKYAVNHAGCGIGAGPLGHVKTIEITGGTVKAYGGSSEKSKSCSSGCGIGTSVSFGTDHGDSNADEIVITGGDITAVGGDNTCGIGGCVKNITIAPATPNTELRLDAYIDDNLASRGGLHHQAGSGIGIANNAANSSYREYPGNITIKGGHIIARAGNHVEPGYYQDGYAFMGAGIGPTSNGRVSSITITGGWINAFGGWCSPGIGGDSKWSDGQGAVDSIHISGGTIVATKATASKDKDPLSGIGGCKSKKERTDIRITGGSVISEGSKYEIGYDAAGQPKNDAGEIVYGTKLKYENPDCGRFTKVQSASFTPALDYDYGLNNVYARAGLGPEGSIAITEFWLPKSDDSSKYSITVDVDEHQYGTFDAALDPVKIEAGDTANAYAYTDLTYVNKITNAKYSGIGVYGNDKLSIEREPDPTPRYLHNGYSDDSGKLVASKGDDPLRPSPLVGSTNYTDENRKWNAKYKEATLYFALEQTEFLVGYDANKPADASNSVEGTMDDDTFSVKGSNTLNENAYTLKGWEFKNWNTEPDGSGTDFVDKESISFVSDWEEKLTLYAQWQPKTYTITYTSGVAGITPDHEQQCEYDKPGKLDTIEEIGWSYDDHVLHGWTTAALGSLYEDGEDFCNLCQLDDSGNPVGKTLVADWVGTGQIKVSVTVDGTPTDVTDNMYIQKISEFETERVNLTDKGDGHYEAPLSGIPEGDYQLLMDSDEYQIPQDKQYLGTLTDSSAVSVVLDYYTVTMQKDDHVSSVYVKAIGTSDPKDSMEAADNTDVAIGASADPGYHFDGYSYYGVEPGWGQDTSVSDQSIAVNGTVDITAHAAHNLYHVKFNGNKPQNASSDVAGEMDNQDFIFDEPQNLKRNEYVLTGWSFNGWNTEPDGSGIRLADNASLGEEQWAELGYPNNDATVELYAQWAPNTYTVYFSATQATSGDMAPQEFLYDDSQPLKKNDFEREDWVFTGWNTEPAGGGTSYADEETVANLTQGRGTTLYAQWESSWRTVTFDLNGGTLDGQTGMIHVEAKKGDVIRVLDAPTREGYSFEYWEGSEYYPGDEYLVDESHTLTAVWKEIPGPVDPVDPDNPDNPVAPDNPVDPGGHTDQTGSSVPANVANRKPGIVPHTGDDHPITLLATLLILSLASAILAATLRQRGY